MKKLALSLIALGMIVSPGARATHPQSQTSRVIVSTTLNSGLVVFDPVSLTETQFLPSRGGGPVRLWPQTVEGRSYLYAANHSVGEGSVGVFELDASGAVSELPLSPFPARPGPVGIAAGMLRVPEQADIPVVFVTNTWFALGGCTMPAGSVTAYDASALGSLGVLEEIGTVETSDPIPWGISVEDGPGHGTVRAYASSNCGGSIDTIAVSVARPLPPSLCVPCRRLGIVRGETRPAAAGSDGTIWDGARSLNYTVNIAASSVSVHDAETDHVLTTVPLPGAGPIDVALADARGGSSWILTSNGRDDTVSLIDRDRVAACVAQAIASCDAEVARIFAGVRGGAPEGVAFDADTSRIFVVNKTPYGQPKLGVIEVTEGSPPTGRAVAQLPLGAVGAATPVPAITAFDVVVAPAGSAHP